MRILGKTLGFVAVSGSIIFASNLSAGVHWKAALAGAVVAKIGTTIAYFVYEMAFESMWKRHPKVEAMQGMDVV